MSREFRWDTKLPTRLFLIGLRGSGKSSVGPILADRLGWEFLDADAILEARAGKTIRQIFDDDGETMFRDLESTVLADLANRSAVVIATGGGVVIRESNRAILSRSGRVVWLTADPETLWRRARGDSLSAERRPALLGGGLAEVEELARRREPLYREVADQIVETTGRSPEQIAAAMLAEWTPSNT